MIETYPVGQFLSLRDETDIVQTDKHPSALAVCSSLTRERFLSRVDMSGGMFACWPWQGSVDAAGYGRSGFKISNFAHRVAYVVSQGAIPSGMDIDHLCHDGVTCTAGNDCLHRRCCNPSHLEPVTHFENCRRGRQAQQTHCINGHPFDSENLIMRFRRSGAPYRQCKPCVRIRSQGNEKAGVTAPATTSQESD